MGGLVLFWGPKDVVNWLSSIHLEIYISQFEWNCVDGLCLLELTERDLRLLDVAHRDQSHLQSQIELLRSGLIHEIEMWDNKSVMKWFQFNGLNDYETNIFRSRKFDGHKFLRVTSQSMTKIKIPKILQKKVLFLQTLAIGKFQTQLQQTPSKFFIQFPISIPLQSTISDTNTPTSPTSPTTPTIPTTPTTPTTPPAPSENLQHHISRFHHKLQSECLATKLNEQQQQDVFMSAPVTSLFHLWHQSKNQNHNRVTKNQLTRFTESRKIDKKHLKSDEVYIKVQAVWEEHSRWRLFRESEGYCTFQTWLKAEYGPNYRAKCWFSGQIGGIRSDKDITMLCWLAKLKKTKVIIHECPDETNDETILLSARVESE
jgi:hypothetical protein